MHRIGGIEKEDGSGNISYDPANHERMVAAARRPRSPASPTTSRRVEVTGDVDDAELLVLGWGSTWGAIDGAMGRLRNRGRKVAHAHLTHLNPFPADLGDVLARYPKVVVPEMNLGQLSKLVRAEFLVDAQLDHQGPGHALHRRRARTIAPRPPREEPGAHDQPRRRSPADHHARTGRRTRRCGGAPGCGDYSILTAVQLLMPDLGVQPRGHGVHLRHRLRRPVPVLHEHLRDALDPRPGARRSPPASPWPAPTSTSGSSAATATRCRSAATT